MLHRLIRLGWLALLLALAACQHGELPSPAPPAGDRATLQANALLQTVSPGATPTSGPTATPVLPTRTPLPTVTAIPPTVAPTSTTTPSALAQAQTKQAVGDTAGAIEAFRAIVAGDPASEEAKRARFGISHASMLAGDDKTATLELRQFVQDYPADPLTAPALFMLGRLYFAAYEWDASADAYGKYIALGGPLADYAQNRIGHAHFSAQRYDRAAQAYEAAATRPDASAPVKRAAWHGLGDTRAKQGDQAGARAAYTAAVNAAGDDEDRGVALYALVQLEQEAGRDAAAQDALRRLWTDFPRTSAAYQAALADAEGSEPTLQYGKGLAAYHRGNNRLAVTAFNRASDLDPAHPADTHLYAGTAYRRLRQYPQAVFHYDQLINTHPGDPLIPDAMLGKARALRQYDTPTARAVYADLIARFPAYRDLAVAGRELGEVVEQVDDCAAAMPLYQQAARMGRTSAALDAQARLAQCQIKTGDRAGAVVNWQALAVSGSPDHRAEGLYWQAKAVASERAQAEAMYSQAIAYAPLSLYGARAREVLGEAAPSAVGEPGRAAGERWLAQQAGRSPADLAAAETEVRQDGDIGRARALYEQGLREAAAKHLRLAWARWRDDPLKLYVLARAAQAMTDYNVGIAVTEAMAEKLGVDPGALPPALLELAYPRPYRSLIEAASARQGVDPALLYAIMRQESRFEAGAESPAGARGLTQVLPSTGESIARALSRPDYNAGDLFKPYVNVEFGAYFLAQQLKRFDGQRWAALAAYNAGPNAVPRWQAASTDPDTQIEAIDYPETVTYVRNVLGNWAAYDALGKVGS